MNNLVSIFSLLISEYSLIHVYLVINLGGLFSLYFTNRTKRLNSQLLKSSYSRSITFKNTLLVKIGPDDFKLMPILSVKN